MALELKKVELASCQFNLPAKTKTVYHLAISRFTRRNRNGKTFRCTADIEFNLFDGIQETDARFICVFHLEYGGDQDGTDLLKDHIIIAHAVPYLREFVYNMTMRSAKPALLLSPINTPDLLRKYLEKSSR